MSTIEQNKRVFDQIYKTHKWIMGSGLGSVPVFNKPGIKFINDFINSHQEIRTILDVGCGDMQVGSHLSINGKKYIGCDVSEVVLKKARKKFGAHNREFLLLDVVNETLPTADLVIVRDVILHLPNEDIIKLLEKLEPYKFVILQTNISNQSVENRDIQTGEFRLLDITKDPFNATKYKLEFTYTESVFSILNPLLIFFRGKPHYKGIYVKSDV